MRVKVQCYQLDGAYMRGLQICVEKSRMWRQRRWRRSATWRVCLHMQKPMNIPW